MSNTVIQVDTLWKEYRLGVISHHTLAKDLQSRWARMRGKEDPNIPLTANSGFNEAHGDERFWALQDVSFEVKQGEILGIIGRNGAGKSTLLKILSQVTTPTKGEVRYKGRIASLLEVGTGFHPELTGRENIFLNGAILGMSKAEIKRKLDEIIAFAEVERFIDTPVKRYSSGMYVRLAFAVAAHLDPEILIVDEVLAVGDAQFQKKCLGKMEEVGRAGRTVLFVSHNLESIRKLCNRGLHVENGRTFYFNDFEDCVKSYLGRSDQIIKPIVSHVTKFSEKLEVTQILVNNRSDDVVTILAGSQSLIIDIIGTVYIKTRAAFEVRFFEASDHAIGIFSPGHFSEKVQYLDPGSFRVKCVVKMPALTQGNYFLSFFFTDPGIEGLLDIPRAVRLLAESETMTTTGSVLENRRGHGSIVLDGEVFFEQGYQ